MRKYNAIASDDINLYLLPPTNEEMIAMAHEFGAEPCGDPRCENGTIVGDEYVTHDGEVDNYTWDCAECQTNPSVYTWDDMTEVPF